MARSWGPTDHPILKVFRDRRQETLDFHSAYYKKLARRYDMYRCVWRGQYGAHRNRIFVPYAFAAIQQSIARMMGMLFGQYPYVDFEGTDPSVAKRNAVLVSSQLRDSRAYEKWYDFLLCADIYGLGCFQDGWKTIRRRERWRTLDEYGNESVQDQRVTRFDGPDLDNVDPLDFAPQPGKGEIFDCAWAQRQYFMDIQDIEQRESMGIFLPGSLAALKEASLNPPPATETAYQERFNLYRSKYAYDAVRTEKHASPVQVVDMWGMIPDELALNGVTWCLVTVANDRVVLRFKEFPFWHGELPFHCFSPARDPHYLHGIGKIEPIETLQFLANRFASQKADALDANIDPGWLVNQNMTNLTQDTLYMKAGKIIGIDGPVGDDVMRPITPDFRGLQAAIQEMGEIGQHIQRATGMVDDVIGGLNTGDRQTKAEFVGRQENALTRVALEAGLADKVLERVADRYRALNGQFLKLPHVVNMLGMDAEINPDTGLMGEPLVGPVTAEDLEPFKYQARAIGATQMLNRSIRRQDVATLTQLYQGNPIAMQALNWVAWLRYTLKQYDVPNPEQFLNKDKVPGINALADQSGMSQSSVMQGLMSASGGGGSSPELVNLLSSGQGGG